MVEAIMAVEVALLIFGGLLVGFTLSDIFDTLVVPETTKFPVNVPHRLSGLLLPTWKIVRSRPRISGMFAPGLIVGSFIIWLMLLLLGFGAAAYGARAGFEPVLGRFSDALYVAGRSLATLSVGAVAEHGLARWVMLSAGFCGLAMVALAIAYLIQIQAGISARDVLIIKMTTAAGEPPSAFNFMQRSARLRNRGALKDVLGEARLWCASLRQTHCAHPSLVYVRAPTAGADWPATLGTFLDLALIARYVIDDPELAGPAAMLRDEGLRAAIGIGMSLHLQPSFADPDGAALARSIASLERSGYPIRAGHDLQFIATERLEEQAFVAALADHLGAAGAASPFNSMIHPHD